MEYEYIDSVTVICPAGWKLADKYGAGGAARNRYDEKEFDAPVTLTDSYETTVKCPNCGARLALSVKTKGRISYARKQRLLREKRAEFVHMLITLVITSALLTAGVLGTVFIAGDTLKVISVCVIVLSFPLWLGMLAAALNSVKYIKRPRLIFEKYEQKNPYMVSLEETSTHYFRGQRKTIVWQTPPVKLKRQAPLRAAGGGRRA